MRKKKQRATLKQSSLFSGLEREGLQESSGRGAGTKGGPCAKASLAALQVPRRENPSPSGQGQVGWNSISFPDCRGTTTQTSSGLTDTADT